MRSPCPMSMSHFLSDAIAQRVLDTELKTSLSRILYCRSRMGILSHLLDCQPTPPTGVRHTLRIATKPFYGISLLLNLESNCHSWWDATALQGLGRDFAV